MSESTIQRAVRVLQDDGIRHLAREGVYFAAELVAARYYRQTGDWERGDHVFDDEDWDVLVVLDACRADLMAEVVDDDHAARWPWAHSGETRWSLASSSEEFMQRSFTNEYADDMAETVHVTSNVFSDAELDADDWAELDEVWRYEWDDRRGTTPARAVINRAVATWRDDEPERMIVWLMHPHAPFINHEWSWTGKSIDCAESEWGGYDSDKTVWNRMRDSEVTREMVWNAYKDNLVYALDEVDRLLSSIDAETVAITSDHGNGLGERGIFGHPSGIACPALREVPWMLATATDTGEVVSGGEQTAEEVTDDDVEERLRALGYR